MESILLIRPQFLDMIVDGNKTRKYSDDLINAFCLDIKASIPRLLSWNRIGFAFW